MKKTNLLQSLFAALVVTFFATIPAMAGEASLVVPDIKAMDINSYNLLLIGLVVSVVLGEDNSMTNHIYFFIGMGIWFFIAVPSLSLI